jgi:hypothetical protein
MAASEFHYVRYYPLLLVAVTTCHLVCASTFINRPNRSKVPLAVLACAALPACFHMTAFVYFLFWSAIFLGGTLLSFRQNHQRQVIFYLGAALTIGVTALVFREFRSFVSLRFEPRLFRVFFSLNSGNGRELFFLLAVVALGAVWSKGLDSFERRLFFISCAALVFCLLVYSIGAAEAALQNPYMYLLFMHPVWLLIVALSLSSIVKRLAELANHRPAFTFVLFVFCAAGFYRYVELSSFFNTPHDVTKKEVAELRQTVDRHQHVLFFGDDSVFFFNYFPNQPSFSFIAHEPPEVVAKQDFSSEGFVVKKKSRLDSLGFVRDYQGEIWAGNKSSFCKVLATYPQFMVVFFKAKISSIEPILRDGVAPFLRSASPVQAESIYQKVCS